MTRTIGLGLARVTVAAPHSRIDVALPEHVLVAELMAGLLRSAGDDLADVGQQHSGWVLRRADGHPVDGNRTLAAQNVLDGEVLYLVPRRTEWPEPEHDDLVNAVAVETRRHARAWSYGTTRGFGLAAASTLLLTLLALLVAPGPPWTGPAATATATGAALLVAAAAFARAVGDVGVGAVLGAVALPYVAVGATLLAAGDFALADFGDAQLLAGCGGLLAASIVADLAVANQSPLFVAGAALALCTALGAVLRLAGLTAAGAAAVLAAAIVVLTPAIPLLSLRLGKLPTPSLPTSTVDLLADEPLPPPALVHARVVRTDQMFTGIVAAASLVLIGCQLLLVANRDISSTVLVMLVAGTSLLRARLFPTARHRLPLLVTGLTGAVALGLATLALDRSTMLPVITTGGITAAAGAVGAGLVYSRRRANPALGRAGDVLEVVGVVAVVPVVCAVLGVYGHIRGLAG